MISDLVTDQRVHRAAITLSQNGFDVMVVGRQLKNSLAMTIQPYQTKRFELWWEKGPLFYMQYNIKLFFFLIMNRADILLSNDLDTLLPNFIVSRLRKTKLVYDSHEYFTEVPELVSRPRTQKIWKGLESYILPKIKNMYTVNESIASFYKEMYHIPVKVIRNVPLLYESNIPSKHQLRFKLNLPIDKMIFILQGSGINIDRGAEEAVEAINKIDGAVLLIAGNGDVIPRLKKMVADLKLEDKIIFKNKMPADELRKYTAAADVGLSLDKDTNLNYRFSLPNKLFDYILAGLPVIASDLPEVKRIVLNYKVGIITASSSADDVAACMLQMMNNPDQISDYKLNTVAAAQVLNWQKEQLVLLNIFESLE